MGIGACELGNRGCGERPEPSLEESKELRLKGRLQSGDPIAVVVRALKTKAHQLRGFRIIEQPQALRHFTARFESV